MFLFLGAFGNLFSECFFPTCQRGGKPKLPASGRSILIEYQYETCFLHRKVLSISYIMCLNFVFHYFPDAIQVIVEKAERSDIPDIDKKKLVYILIIISLYPYFMKFVHLWILVIFETLLYYEIFVSCLVRLESLTLLAC